MRKVIVSILVLISVCACTPEEVERYFAFRALLVEEARDEHPDPEHWLVQTRRCESTNTYEVVSRSGRYRGAYQFSQSTWNWVAERYMPWLVGVDPAQAAPWDQDLMALALLGDDQDGGRGHWPVCGR